MLALRNIKLKARLKKCKNGPTKQAALLKIYIAPEQTQGLKKQKL